MGLLYNRGDLVFQFLRYVVFIGMCTKDLNFQLKKSVYTLCFKPLSQDLVFDSSDIHRIKISNIFMLGSHQFRTSN